MLKILQSSLQQYVNRELPGVQAGFRKGQGTRYQIANIHWIMQKVRELEKNTYFVRKHLTGGFLCAMLDLTGILWSLLILEYSGINRRGMPFPGLNNPGISFVSLSLW